MSSASNDSSPSARDAQRLDHLADQRQLRGQIDVHFRPLLFVGLVHRVAEGLAGQVERREQVVRPFLFQQVEQVPREAEDGSHRLALRAGHRRQGVENLVDQRIRVDHVDFLPHQRIRRRGRHEGNRRRGFAGGHPRNRRRHRLFPSQRRSCQRRRVLSRRRRRGIEVEKLLLAGGFGHGRKV